MRTYCITAFLSFFLLGCNQQDQVVKQEKSTFEYALDESLQLNEAQAARLLELPLKCITNPLPYKSGIVIAKESDLAMPVSHHPAFYGCFDWHSAVHGHWSIVYLLKTFPNLEKAQQARDLLNQNLTKANIEKEIAYFSLNKYTKSFERTYGWAWLLKLQEELHTWDDADARKWETALQPLCDLIADKYIEYLPKLVYPIRVGEHSNTAFGLTFAYDYAVTLEKSELKGMIASRTKDFFSQDKGCPISWEPSGYDFLSPCLEEADIMRRILSKEDYKTWVENFIPEVLSDHNYIQPGEVKDRSDGKLVHLDGLNFSRAWVLYSLALQYEDNGSILKIADDHMKHSLPKITDGDYSGEHWLASFALYALKTRSELQ